MILKEERKNQVCLFRFSSWPSHLVLFEERYQTLALLAQSVLTFSLCLNVCMIATRKSTYLVEF